MQCYETSQSKNPQITEISLPSWTANRSDIPEININTKVTYQEHIGIGGAFTESAAVNYRQLNPAAKKEFIKAYFDANQGSAYNFCRIHMNSCDFSLGNWACQESENGEFSVEHYEEAIFPMIRDAEAMLGKKIKFLVSPWSPPSWMKTTGEMNNGGQLKPEYRQQWAQYYVTFIKALQEKGFEIWGLTIQNEPAATQIWDSCIYSPEEERDFIRDNLGPALHAANLEDIKVICWDHNRDYLYQRAHVILSDPKAAQYVWGSGFHWYMDDCFDNVQAVHDAFPDKNLIFTEGCQEGGPHHGEWAVAERYGKSVINDFRHWTRGWLDWNLMLDHQGGPNHVGNLCSAPILGTETGETFDLQPSYYYLQHLSPKFIPEGSKRVLSASASDSLLNVAFTRPDGKVVVAVMNDTNDSMPFSIVLNGQYLHCESSAHSMQTYIL